MGSKILTFAKKRYTLYAIVTVLALVIPFIRINGNHLFLLSFDKKELNLFFNSFSTQELYLMPFVLIFFFLFIFFITTLAGRVWCGWACPQTVFRVIFRDLIQTKLLKIRKSTANKQVEPNDKFNEILSILIFVPIALLAASNLMWFFIPPEDFFTYIKTPAEHPLLIGIVFGFTAFLCFDIILLQEKFCVYVCPYARIQSTMFDNDTVAVVYDTARGGKIYDEQKHLISNKPSSGECIGCNACVRICPTHIDIRKGMQLECINCLECADACSSVMAKFDKPSLINWTSQNASDTKNKIKFIRFRTVAYVIMLSIALSGLFFMSTKKENMLLNVNRSTELYKINDGEVVNDYVFLFENTDKKDHKYFFSIDLDGVKIKRPLEPISIKAGFKRKVVVQLSTNTKPNGVDNSVKDALIPILIKAFATDDEKISVTRKSIFVYPKEELLSVEK